MPKPYHKRILQSSLKTKLYFENQKEETPRYIGVNFLGFVKTKTFNIMKELK